jgi:phosphoribosylanthranilate isomerase
MTAVKICGLTRAEDVELVCALGAAYVGFNFVESSLRRVSPQAARALSDAASPGVLRVGVFKTEGPDAVANAVERARLDLIQLHRPLTKADLDRAPVPLIAVAPSDRGALSDLPLALLARCHAVLLDSSEGTGRALDAAAVRPASWPVPVFLAGGLDAESVGAAIRALRPAGVDIASGGESAPGVKDRVKLTRLFEAVREADAEA